MRKDQIMGTAIQSYQDQGQAEQALQWVMRLHGLPAEKLPSVTEVQAVVAGLSKPVEPDWLSQRIKGLMAQYYEKNLDAASMAFVSMDWVDALADFPQWAIDRAVRWYKSADNPRRHKAPLEGDIAERARYELELLLPAKRFVLENTKQKNQRQEVVLTEQQRKDRSAEIADVLKSLNAKVAAENAAMKKAVLP